MFYVLIILYVALSDLYTFISTEVMIHFFAPIVNEKIKVGWSKLIVGWKTLEITLGMFSESDLLL